MGWGVRIFISGSMVMKAVIFFSGLAGFLIFGPPILNHSRADHAEVVVTVREAISQEVATEVSREVVAEVSREVAAEASRASGGRHLMGNQSHCRHEAERSLTVSGAGVEELRVLAGSGSLEVVGVDGLGEIRAVGRACASHQEFLEELQLSSESSGPTLILETHYPEWRGWSMGNRYARMDLRVEVPSAMDSDIQDGSGEMRLSKLGTVTVQDGSGEVFLSDIRGDLTVEDGSGELDIRGVAGFVALQDGSGEVLLTDVGAGAEIQDSSGDLEIVGVRGSVTLHDSSGEVDVREVTGTVRVVRDSSGDISVRNIGGDFIVERDGSGDIRHSAVQGTVDIPRKKRGR
jgi:hypothetical protein